jgi:hypothetical protein
MKAVFIERHGGPEELRFGDLPDPVAKPGEIIVDILPRASTPPIGRCAPASLRSVQGGRHRHAAGIANCSASEG